MQFFFRRLKLAGGLVVEASIKYINTLGGKTLNCKDDGKMKEVFVALLKLKDFSLGEGGATKESKKIKKIMNYFSLFSGIGGFELGIGEKGNCVGFSEIDKYATQIYKNHFPEHTNYGDITRITAESLHDFDLLVGGFPCQSFSIAGKRRGFDDTRGTLFFDIARILEAKHPQFFLLENVKGLLSHDDGNTFKTIISTLDELGYDLQWQVLNSKNFGVPQNRERVFIVGHLRGTSRPQVFPFGSSNEEADGKTASTAIDSNYWKGVDNHGQRTMIVNFLNVEHAPQSQRVIGIDGLSTTLNALGGGQGAKTGLYNIGDRIRRLTPIECERLQGFPDGWTEGASDTQRYKMLGNAVTVSVIQAIVDKLFA